MPEADRVGGLTRANSLESPPPSLADMVVVTCSISTPAGGRAVAEASSRDFEGAGKAAVDGLGDLQAPHASSMSC